MAKEAKLKNWLRAGGHRGIAPTARQNELELIVLIGQKFRGGLSPSPIIFKFDEFVIDKKSEFIKAAPLELLKDGDTPGGIGMGAEQ